MAPTPIPVTDLIRTGTGTIDPAEVDGNTVDGMTMTNGPGYWFEVRNSNVSTVRNVTIAFKEKVDGQTVPARSYAIPASSKRRIGNLPIELFGSSLVITADHTELKFLGFHAP